MPVIILDKSIIRESNYINNLNEHSTLDNGIFFRNDLERDTFQCRSTDREMILHDINTPWNWRIDIDTIGGFLLCDHEELSLSFNGEQYPILMRGDFYVLRACCFKFADLPKLMCALSSYIKDAFIDDWIPSSAIRIRISPSVFNSSMSAFTPECLINGFTANKSDEEINELFLNNEYSRTLFESEELWR